MILYTILIAALAQIILTQRFEVIPRRGRAHSFLPLQDLRDNVEEKMGRGYPVYSHRHAVGCWSLYDRLCRSEPRSVPRPYQTCARVPER